MNKGETATTLFIGLILFVAILFVGSNLTGMVSTVYNYTNNITQVLQNITYTYNITCNNTCNATGGFPAPNYNSGWINMTAGVTYNLTHNLGGDVNNYFVDISAYDTRNDTTLYHNLYLGMDWADPTTNRGFYWKNLNSTHISIYRATYDTRAGSLRVRIWTYS
jgi:hypothetical protein